MSCFKSQPSPGIAHPVAYVFNGKTVSAKLQAHGISGVKDLIASVWATHPSSVPQKMRSYSGRNFE